MGVLHQTGEMLKAIETQVINKTKWIPIFAPLYTANIIPPTAILVYVKQKYNKATNSPNENGTMVYLGVLSKSKTFKYSSTHQDTLYHINIAAINGFVHDIVDWLGGLANEFADIET
jgi:hypothetical protein